LRRGGLLHLETLLLAVLAASITITHGQSDFLRTRCLIQGGDGDKPCTHAFSIEDHPADFRRAVTLDFMCIYSRPTLIT
jgi:hypothetical protein